MNTKLYAVADLESRPMRFFKTAGEASNNTGTAALLGCVPEAEWLKGDLGYGAD